MAGHSCFSEQWGPQADSSTLGAEINTWGRQHSTWIHVFLGGSWTHFEDVISLKKKDPALPQGLKERSLRG